MVGIGVITNQKRNLISPVDAKAEVPIIEKKTGQVISISGKTVQLMDLETYQTFDADMPDDEALAKELASGVEVEYWLMMGKSKIIRRK